TRAEIRRPSDDSHAGSRSGGRFAPLSGMTGSLTGWRVHRAPSPFAIRHSPFAPLCPHRLFQVLVDLVEEAGGGEPLLVGADEEGEVFGHVARLDGIDAHPLQGV